MHNESFDCKNCGSSIPKHPTGSARNHCPSCLFSLHVDDRFPGDRAAKCEGLMKPTDIDHHSKKGYMLVHQCLICWKIQKNCLAPDDQFLTFVRERNKHSANNYR